MANCTNCGTPVNEGTQFCPNCGAPQAAPQQPQAAPQQPSFTDTPNTTTQFSPADIEQNKVMAVLAYIIFLIPLLAAKDSPYAKFHTNQGLVLFIAGILSSVVAIIPILGWIAAPILGLVITVLAIIGIINALNGQAKELPLVGKYRILK